MIKKKFTVTKWHLDELWVSKQFHETMTLRQLIPLTWRSHVTPLQVKVNPQGYSSRSHIYTIQGQIRSRSLYSHNALFPSFLLHCQQLITNSKPHLSLQFAPIKSHGTEKNSCLHNLHNKPHPFHFSKIHTYWHWNKSQVQI